MYELFLIIATVMFIGLSIALSILLSSKENLQLQKNTCLYATPTNVNMCDPDMKISCEWGFQWIYYLQNIITPGKGSTEPLEIIGYIIPIGCTNSMCLAIVIIQYSYGTGTTRITGRKMGLKFIIPGEKFSINIKEKGISYSISRSPESLLVTIPDLKHIGALQIFDGVSGMCPQGNNGYVRSGPNIHDTAYSCSFLRTTVIERISAKNIGFGYGEFVKGTFPPNNSSKSCCNSNLHPPLLKLAAAKFPNHSVPTLQSNPNLAGWHCFYFHMNINEQKVDVQACRSRWKNQNGDPYSRMNVIYDQNCANRKWCECYDFSNNKCPNGSSTAVQWDENTITSWTSPQSNVKYNIGYTVYVPKNSNAVCGGTDDNFWKIQAVPEFKDAEVLDGLTKYSWFGTTKLFLVHPDGNKEPVGNGITEVFKFS